MTSLLILSFSPIASDARVLKQIAEFAGDFDVTTCGYGEAPPLAARHIRIPDGVAADDLSGRLITMRMYRRVYWSIPAVRWCVENLVPGTRDIVLANDVESVPLALKLRPRLGVHADLHEYSPLLREESAAWKRRISPYVSWLCRRYVARADSWTTVGRGLAREYANQFGFGPTVVTNAAPYVDAEPTPVHEPLRLVHSGACLRNRRLDETLRGVLASDSGATLDLYLTPNDPGHLAELKDLAAASGGRVTVHDPVPYAQLAETLRGFDLGVHVLAPTNFNNRWALPNKLFDYVQARLGILIGPSPEMAEYVTEYGIGVVTAGFEASDITAALDTLTSDDVALAKSAAHAHARELSADTQVEGWREAIESIAAVR